MAASSRAARVPSPSTPAQLDDAWARRAARSSSTRSRAAYGGHRRLAGAGGNRRRSCRSASACGPSDCWRSAAARSSPARRDAIAGVVAIAIERARFLDDRHARRWRRQRADLSSALLAALGHDLRTPLTAIRVAVTNAGDGELRRRRSGRIRPALAVAEIDHLARLLQEILDMARIRREAVARRTPVGHRRRRSWKPPIAHAGQRARRARPRRGRRRDGRTAARSRGSRRRRSPTCSRTPRGTRRPAPPSTCGASGARRGAARHRDRRGTWPARRGPRAPVRAVRARQGRAHAARPAPAWGSRSRGVARGRRRPRVGRAARTRPGGAVHPRGRRRPAGGRRRGGVVVTARSSSSTTSRASSRPSARCSRRAATRCTRRRRGETALEAVDRHAPGAGRSSTSGCPTSRAWRSAGASARAGACRSSCCRRAAPRPTRSRRSTPAPTTTSPSRSARRSCWPGSRAAAPACRTRDDGVGTDRPRRHLTIGRGHPARHAARRGAPAHAEGVRTAAVLRAACRAGC